MVGRREGGGGDEGGGGGVGRKGKENALVLKDLAKEGGGGGEGGGDSRAKRMLWYGEGKFLRNADQGGNYMHARSTTACGEDTREKKN